MNNLKGINKAQELQKIQTLKQITQGVKSGEFNINLNPVHLDKTPQNPNTTVLGKIKSAAFTPAKGIANSTKDLVKVVKDPRKNFLNLKGLEKIKSQPVFSAGKVTSSLNKSLLNPYLMNNINHISLSPIIGIKNGVLLKYQKLISYNFNSSTTNPLSSSTYSVNLPAAFSKGNFIPRVKDGVTLPLDHSNGGLDKNSPANSNVVLSYKACTGEVKDTYELLYYFFKSIYCLISKPVFLHSADKVIIQLFYYLSIPKKKVFKFFSIMYISSFKTKWLKKKSQAFSIRKNSKILGKYPAGTNAQNFKNRNGKLFIKWRVLKSISRLRSKSNNIRSLLFNLRKFNLSKVFPRKFYLICQILSRKFNKAVEFQLIRLHHPYHDSNILINLLSLNIKNKTKNARVAINKIYAKNQVKNINDPNLNSINLIPAFLSGIYIKIAGRLMREPIIPRITTKTYERGASSTGKVNYLDVATITKKNRKGAYTIKIKSGQNFFIAPPLGEVPLNNKKG